MAVRSPSGISQAVIESSGGNWPDTVILHMHLKGLEHLKVSNGIDTLECEVSSHAAKLTTRQWMDGMEDTALTATSPYWMEIRSVGNDGTSLNTIPLKAGYFEIRLPTTITQASPKSITINWIDFYR